MKQNAITKIKYFVILPPKKLLGRITITFTILYEKHELLLTIFFIKVWFFLLKDVMIYSY